jgi:hypothetical protein
MKPIVNNERTITGINGTVTKKGRPIITINKIKKRYTAFLKILFINAGYSSFVFQKM